ncbi:MAG: ATP-binding protein [Thermoguttaceae bacterium]
MGKKTPGRGGKYRMTISRLTVDKLGVKLYDRVSAVIAEIVANSYDGDAKEVVVTAPMGEYLATKTKGALHDKGFVIEVKDDGIGMTPDEVNNYYLKVGAERRNDPKRGDTSRIFKRRVMGRKGVGKLAPFGIFQKIEIITAGGKRIAENGKRGYRIAHLILDRGMILADTDTAYYPAIGEEDETLSPSPGTTVRLYDFDHRQVPALEDFERQLSQRFGIASSDWRITLVDALKTDGDPQQSRTVGQFEVATMPGTTLRFEATKTARGRIKHRAVDSSGEKLDDLDAGFKYEDTFYPVTGWVAYSQHPYKDYLMAGVRIYCRGKIAAQTNIFNLKAGFTGEYDIRSYLVGELHADWLDEADDLIRTDRQDILWSHALGQEFQAWGQSMVKKIGTISREPKRKRTWEFFKEISQIEDRVATQFPRDEQEAIRNNTLEIARIIAKSAREDELRDADHLEALVGLSLLLGPHITLDRKLCEAAESAGDPLSVITSILATARTAELSAFGKIAEDRVKVIKRIEQLKDNKKTLEAAFQSLIANTPWLIDPQWSPITANQSFTTLKLEFQKFYKERTGKRLVLDDFADPAKRADFVLSSQDNVVQIIEIKKPGHALTNEEMDRINKYADLMTEFLEEPGNDEIKEVFSHFRITLVCDRLNLSGVHKKAFEAFQDKGTLTHITWRVFLLRTRKTHEAFLNEAERQQKNAPPK